MSEAYDETGTGAEIAGPSASGAAASATASTDRPIPLWPEGVLAVAAGVTLVVIGMRHRAYLQRKLRECQRAVDEFQRHGGVDELSHIASQVANVLKGPAS